MLIYTGRVGGKKAKRAKRLGMGFMLGSYDSRIDPAKFLGAPLALDNGAYSAYTKGVPFDMGKFLESIENMKRNNAILNFVVLPDIVAGGLDSLSFSEAHIETVRNLCGDTPLALVVQDGMEPPDIEPFVGRVGVVFVGGTVPWKDATSQEWCEFAHSHGLLCHIGRRGKLCDLLHAYKAGADSVDSTSFARNDSWHIVEEFQRIISENVPSELDLHNDSGRGRPLWTGGSFLPL